MIIVKEASFYDTETKYMQPVINAIIKTLIICFILERSSKLMVNPKRVGNLFYRFYSMLQSASYKNRCQDKCKLMDVLSIRNLIFLECKFVGFFVVSGSLENVTFALSRIKDTLSWTSISQSLLFLSNLTFSRETFISKLYQSTSCLRYSKTFISMYEVLNKYFCRIQTVMSDQI